MDDFDKFLEVYNEVKNMDEISDVASWVKHLPEGWKLAGKIFNNLLKPQNIDFKLLEVNESLRFNVRQDPDTVKAVRKKIFNIMFNHKEKYEFTSVVLKGTLYVTRVR